VTYVKPPGSLELAVIYIRYVFFLLSLSLSLSLSLFFPWWGETGSLGTAATYWPIAPAPDDR
jgi:hypothetical protein